MHPVRSNQSSWLLNRLLMPPCTKLDTPILIFATCYQGLSMSLWRLFGTPVAFLAKQGCSQRNAVTGLCTIDFLTAISLLHHRAWTTTFSVIIFTHSPFSSR
ncbi:hypothetical protein FVEG_16490 [Fusarium verticillioides 7600]|uniref:Uncharacterized protein n=1 Tax=Gibberella moniliformis (strain M3125 / FGSC 7600) TaxID=334819 RepID=W7MPB1_GIBM7|nr:hypothetical protein FVEG_16490 [Fusarium verticillioides 7600]XP_018755621.1 hypothetical protein FVEG_16490 [Fusarium verticillioides 7600]XP_018755622.1 hypothetical protein FVEG_16490 [Fusarium verticillioides 7600]XP_018755623.1 hypothetical protein FVEG_16490 [Fusarium verticillioides 7600]XP_018755624.1 hypothetical protein FVEG_16490 [Fusarium verticillioides 7600]EWG49429.1 hypothetical protein FVEG_16490 [Fusarium verticillioides 7600]EWG49430.1 hypothetical protein FVEG_16490 [F